MWLCHIHILVMISWCLRFACRIRFNLIFSELNNWNWGDDVGAKNKHKFLSNERIERERERERGNDIDDTTILECVTHKRFFCSVFDHRNRLDLFIYFLQFRIETLPNANWFRPRAHEVRVLTVTCAAKRLVMKSSATVIQSHCTSDFYLFCLFLSSILSARLQLDFFSRQKRSNSRRTSNRKGYGVLRECIGFDVMSRFIQHISDKTENILQNLFPNWNWFVWCARACGVITCYLEWAS